MATPAASRAAALWRGRPRRQVRAPGQVRTGNPPQRTRELGGREPPAATSTRATTTSRGLIRGRAKLWHLRGLGRSALPKPPPGTMGVSRNLSRALRVPSGWPTATLDRTRPTDGHGLGRWSSARVPILMMARTIAGRSSRLARHTTTMKAAPMRRQSTRSPASKSPIRPTIGTAAWAADARLSISSCQIEHANGIIMLPRSY